MHALRRNTCAEVLNMSARTFLRRAEQLHAAIQIKKEQISCMRHTLTEFTISPDKERVSHTSTQSPVECAVIRVEELENQLETEIAHYFEVQQEITQAINRLESVCLCSILTKRYILFKPWSAIAEEIGVSEKWLYNQHNYALKKMEQILMTIGTPECNSDTGKLKTRDCLACSADKS